MTKISLPVAYGSSSQFKKETEIFGYNRKKLLVMATRMLGDVEQAGWKRVALFRTDSFDLLLLSLILAPILLSSRLFQEWPVLPFIPDPHLNPQHRQKGIWWFKNKNWHLFWFFVYEFSIHPGGKWKCKRNPLAVTYLYGGIKIGVWYKALIFLWIH